MPRADLPAVLLADDDEATCTLIRAILHRDFRVDVAGDGAEAIGKLRTNRYAAILLDLKMAGTSGFGVLDHLRAHDEASLGRVLIVTANVNRADLDRVNGYGVCGVIYKPFEVELLLDAVKACAGASGGGLTTAFSGGILLLVAEMHRWV